MRIEDILKDIQPYEHKKCKKIINKGRSKIKKINENLSKKDIKKLMSNRAYKRNSRGAIEQVR